VDQSFDPSRPTWTKAPKGTSFGDATVDELVRPSGCRHLPGSDCVLQQSEMRSLEKSTSNTSDVDLVTDGDDLARVIDVLPAELRDVNESVPCRPSPRRRRS